MSGTSKKSVRFLVGLFLAADFCFCRSAFCGAPDIRIVPAPQKIVWGESFAAVDLSWSICFDHKNEELNFIAGKLGAVFENAAALTLPGEGIPPVLKKKNIVLSLIDENTAENLRRPLSPEETQLLGKEGYVLETGEMKIVIAARSTAGIFYGAQTLRQLLNVRGDRIIIPECRIIDYPAVPIRGAHFLGIDKQHIFEQLDLMAQYKLNMAIFESKDFFNLNDFKTKGEIEKVFNYARKLYIEPVPQLSSFSHVAQILEKNPACAEGDWVDNAPYRFDKDYAVPVRKGKDSLTNLLLTDDSPLRMVSKQGDVEYLRGEDFQISGFHVRYPYDTTQESAPFIRRLPAGKLRGGDEVLLSYNQVKSKNELTAYCPSEKMTYEIMFSALENVCRYLSPRFIHLGHDEIIGMNKDSRCRRRNLTNARLLADDIVCLYGFIKKLNADIQIMLWDDMLNPLHHGGDENYQVPAGGYPGRTCDALKFIPKDILIVIWWYDEWDRLHKIKESPDYFSRQGFNYFVSAWKNKKNILEWLQAAKHKKECRGIIVTNWDGWADNVKNIIFGAAGAWEG